MKTTISTLILLGTMLIPTAPVMASNYLNGKQSVKVTAAQATVLENLQQDMTTKLTEIEVELTQGNSAKALRIAKGVLDNVRTKTGIDPKSKIEDSFRVQLKFGKSVSSFLDLPEDQKRVVIETISDYHGGLYLDIMNLSKRTSLLYTKAFQAELEKQGGLTQTDKNKILKDLVRASIIPMTVEDKSKSKIVVFDEDVANEDHIYLFNRELKMYVLGNKVLGIDEFDFDNEVRSMKQDLDSKRPSPIKKAQPQDPKKRGSKEEAYACIETAASLRKYSTSALSNATYQCVTKYAASLSSMSECKDYVFSSGIDQASTSGLANAIDVCMATFMK